MPKSKPKSKSEAGFHVYVGLSSVLFLLGKDSPLAILFWILLSIWLVRNHRRLFFWGFCLCILLAIRFYQTSEPFPPKAFIESSGRVSDVMESAFRMRMDGKSILVYSRVEGLIPGDQIQVSGSWHVPDLKNNAHTFDYASYLRSDGVYGILYAYDIEVLDHSFHPNQIKLAFDGYLRKAFGEAAYPYLRLVVLGNDDFVEAETANSIRTMGISHLFAISGMHLGILLGFLHGFYRKLFLRIDRYVWLDGGFLLLYNLVTGWQVSLLRASILALIIAIPALSKRYSKIDIMTWILVAFLGFNPFLLRQIGFQLSFLISYAILFSGVLLKDKKGFSSDFLVTCIANLVSLPIVLEANKELAIFILVYNVVFVFLVGKILLPATFLVLLIPPFQTVFLWLIRAFEFTIAFAAKTAFVVRINFGGPIYIALYWITLFSMLGRIETKKRFVNQAMGLVLLLITSAIVPKLPVAPSVTFFDVNQGDSILIQDQGCRMLIDTGESDDYDSLSDSLRGENIHRLDFIVITHNHDDHFGELVDLLNHFEIAQIIAAKPLLVPTETKTLLFKTNDSFVCGESKFTVLSSDAMSNEENNNSLVLLGEIGGETWLFTGDAESVIESNLIERCSGPIDHLKIGHHGSLTSTSVEFLDHFDPLDAIISVGFPNSFGHPDEEIIERLEQRNISILRTDQDGMISFHYQPWLNLVVVSTLDRTDLRAFFWERIRFIRQIGGASWTFSDIILDG